jgi:hypothetical protein
VVGDGTYSAASRSWSASGTKKSVSVMPRGSKIRSRRNTSRGWPDDDLDETAEHVGADAVVPLAARLEQQRERGPALAVVGQRQLPGRAPLVAPGAVHRVDGRGVVEAVGQPGGVGEEVPHADGLDLGLEDRVHGRADR